MSLPLCTAGRHNNTCTYTRVYALYSELKLHFVYMLITHNTHMLKDPSITLVTLVLIISIFSSYKSHINICSIVRRKLRKLVVLVLASVSIWTSMGRIEMSLPFHSLGPRTDSHHNKSLRVAESSVSFSFQQVLLLSSLYALCNGNLPGATIPVIATHWPHTLARRRADMRSSFSTRLISLT